MTLAQSAATALSAYPRWMVVAGGTVAAAVAIWIFSKVLHWALWLAIAAVLVGGGLLTLRLLLR